MSNYNYFKHYSIVFNEDIIKRITFIPSSSGIDSIQVDLHSLSCKEAKKIIHTIISLTRYEFVLDLIHGYNHGTSLKQMILELKHRRIIKKWNNAWNPGETFFKIGI